MSVMLVCTGWYVSAQVLGLAVFCSCSYHLEFPSFGYSKQFYHILFSPPTQNLLLQSSLSASLVPLLTPAQRLGFGRSIADIAGL